MPTKMPAQHNDAIIREENLRVCWCCWEMVSESLDLKSGLNFDELNVTVLM